MKSSLPINIMFVINDKILEIQVRKKLVSLEVSSEWRARFVRSGSEAISVLKDNPDIDIVFTEMNLPAMNGLTLLRHLQEGYVRVKSVLFLPDAEIKTIRVALNMGAFDFLLLPLDPNDFEQTFNKTLNESQLVNQAISDYDELIALEQEMGIARQIQETVNDTKDIRFNSETTIQISGRNHVGESVSGDFFDYFFIDDNRLGFVIGDVASKGLPAALYMAFSKTLLKSIAMQGMDPGKCLEEVNKILFLEGDPSLFIAIFYGILNIRSGKLEYCNGGHTRPYLADGNGLLNPMNNPDGMVLGVVEEVAYTTQHLRLQAGNLLFLYTGGFSELTNQEGDPVFENDIKMLLKKSNSQTPNELIENIYLHMSEVTDKSSLRDDLTCLSLKYLGPPEEDNNRYAYQKNEKIISEQ
jgi:sigma-B regulation protein RsbU (phosphoserine phosphatase)